VTVEANKEIVRAFVEAGNRNDVDAFDSLPAPGFVGHCEATPRVNVTSCEDFERFYLETAATFPDQKMTLGTLVAEGDLVAFRGKFSGTQKGAMGPFPPTGKFVESDCAGIFQVENGRIVRLWVSWDNLGGTMQLGLLPPSSAPPA
jgi:predicted ester cyclase